jgi:hypothetical protein
MGVIAEAWGIEVSFYLIGFIFLLATLALAVVARSVVGHKQAPR